MPAPRFDEQIKIFQMLWLAMFASPAILFVAGFVMRPNRNDQHVAVPLLALAAIAAAAVSVVMPGVTLKKRLAQKTFPLAEDAGETNDYRSGSEKIRVLAEPEAAMHVVLGAYGQSMIAGLGAAEAVALLGFMAAYFERVMWEAAPFFVVSLALMTLRFPTREKVIATLESASGAKYTAR